MAPLIASVLGSVYSVDVVGDVEEGEEVASEVHTVELDSWPDSGDEVYESYSPMMELLDSLCLEVLSLVQQTCLFLHA